MLPRIASLVVVLTLATCPAVVAGCLVPSSSATGVFIDVPSSYWAYAAIQLVATEGIMPGCGGDFFCPGDAVTREDMALFLERFIHIGTPGYVPPEPTGTPVFSDVPHTSCYACWIEQLAADGITSGCGGGMYCPYRPVTRGEMTVFVLGSRSLLAQDGHCCPPPDLCETNGPIFTDVPCTNPYVDFIEEMARMCILSGCSATTFCPSDTITRAEMAVYLAGTMLSLTDDLCA